MYEVNETNTNNGNSNKIIKKKEQTAKRVTKENTKTAWKYGTTIQFNSAMRYYSIMHSIDLRYEQNIIAISDSRRLFAASDQIVSNASLL